LIAHAAEAFSLSYHVYDREIKSRIKRKELMQTNFYSLSKSNYIGVYILAHVNIMQPVFHYFGF